MSGSTSLWYPHYVGDYMRKTRHLSMLEHGAYRLLLDWYYANGRALDANASFLHRVCSAFAPDEQEAVHRVLHEFFTLEDGRWVHHRAEEELAKRCDITEKRREAANRRWGNRDAKAHASADANAHTSTATPTREEANASSIAHRRGSRLSEDWSLPDEWAAWAAQDHGMSWERIDHEADRFKDYWLAAPGQKGVKRDWFATWRNWCRNSRPDRRTASGEVDRIVAIGRRLDGAGRGAG